MRSEGSDGQAREEREEILIEMEQVCTMRKGDAEGGSGGGVRNEAELGKAGRVEGQEGVEKKKQVGAKGRGSSGLKEGIGAEERGAGQGTRTSGQILMQTSRWLSFQCRFWWAELQ